MILYDEDGNDVNLTGKPPHHTTEGRLVRERNGKIEVEGMGSLNGGFVQPNPNIYIPDLRRRRIMNGDDLNYNDYMIDTVRHKVIFRDSTGFARLAVDWSELVTVVRPNCTWSQWQNIHRDLSRAVAEAAVEAVAEAEADDPRGRVAKIGEEVGTFGTLKGVNKTLQSATFLTHDGSSTEVSASMVSTIAAGLAKAGAISIDAAEGVSKVLRENGVSGNPAVTPEYIIDLIVQAIYAEPDQFVAAGQWITRLTVAISKIAQEAPDES